MSKPVAKNTVVVAHQFGRAFADAIGSRLPGGVTLVTLPAETCWDIPAEAEVLVVEPANAQAVPASAPHGWPRRLKWAQLQTTGIDKYPAWVFDGVLVTCGRGTNSGPISEFAIAAMLAVEKGMPGIWISSPAQWRAFPLGTLQGKTVGLLGLGSLGSAVARRAEAFGMRILAHRRNHQSAPDAGVELASLDTVLGESDHLVVTLPLTPDTHQLLGPRQFALMKASAHVVNVSRGGVLDQQALIDALDAGRLGFASLDVTDPEPLPDGHPLYRHPRVHLSPHTSWSSGAGFEPFIGLFLDNLERYLEGRELIHLVSVDRGY